MGWPWPWRREGAHVVGEHTGTQAFSFLQTLKAQLVSDPGTDQGERRSGYTLVRQGRTAVG